MVSKEALQKKSTEAPRKSADIKGLSRAPSSDSVVSRLTTLQRTIGNRAVEQLFSSGVLQAKLKMQRVVIEAGATTSPGTKEPEEECAGWFSDHESTSKRAAEYYVRTELTGNRGIVEKIECDLFNPDTGAFACTVHFSDGTPIRVIVRRDAIIVGVYPLQTMHPPPDRPLCWYDYTCPGSNRDLVLTKRKCQTSKPAQGAPPPKAHGPEP